MILILFTIAFVLGPALFLQLTRTDGYLWPLALVALIMVGLSFVSRQDASLILPAQAGPIQLGPLLLSVFLIWAAWILVLVLMARAVCKRHPGPVARRWARSMGAVGTTVPWFGFATANMMAE